MHCRLWIWLALAWFSGGGCAYLGERIATSPGTIEQQRLRATIHDPYPDPNAGPEVVGGRPREYANPLPEPVRNRIYADSWWWRR